MPIEWIRFLALLALVSLSCPTSGFSQVRLCGEAPIVEDGKLKGELETKAQFLSRFLGDASLKGHIETEKNDVLSRYPNADNLRLNQYFLYVVCIAIMADNKMSTTEKLSELTKARASIFAR
jgi:hypothetical protein